MGRSRLVEVACLAVCLAAMSGCRHAERAPDAPRATEPAGEASVFFTREVRGDRDGLTELAALARPLIEAFTDALRLAGAEAAGRGGVADELRIFDLDREPRELAVTIDWLDEPRGEGLRVTLRRESLAGRAASLSVALLDLLRAPPFAAVVDGSPDRAHFVLARAAAGERGSPGAEVRHELQLEHRMFEGESDTSVIELRSGDARTRVISAEVVTQLDRLAQHLYRPHTHDGYAARVRASTTPPRDRPAVPRGTSFPALAAP